MIYKSSEGMVVSESVSESESVSDSKMNVEWLEVDEEVAGE